MPTESVAFLATNPFNILPFLKKPLHCKSVPRYGEKIKTTASAAVFDPHGSRDDLDPLNLDRILEHSENCSIPCFLLLKFHDSLNIFQPTGQPLEGLGIVVLAEGGDGKVGVTKVVKERQDIKATATAAVRLALHRECFEPRARSAERSILPFMALVFCGDKCQPSAAPSKRKRSQIGIIELLVIHVLC